MVISRTVIWFRVRVPVLSELIAEVEPSVSTAGRTFMMAFFLAMLTEPTDRIVVTTAGSASGIEPTASATPIPKSAMKDSPCARPITTIATKAKSAARMMKMVSRSTCLVSGDFSTFWPASMWAMWPTSEPMPVVVTRISPWPRVTLVFMNAMFSAVADAATSGA